MRFRHFLAAMLIPVSLLAACTQKPVPDTTETMQPFLLSESTLGHIAINHSVKEALAAADADGHPLAKKETLDPNCDYLFPQDEEAGFAVMFEQGKTVRFDVTNPGISTTRGLKAGDTEAMVKEAYGEENVEVQPHKYVEEGHYLVVAPQGKESPYRLIFVTDGEKVISIKAGKMPAVGYIEGCS